ncbi:MBOAT family protein [Kiritimatiellota bacterium B12222]|nr:MBOAT family protein [Kiritimatiellota bacterium B12222]
MVFSSEIFLFIFLPLVLGIYFLLPARVKNLFLLAASLCFYAWGEGFYLWVMLASISFNYGMGLWLSPENPKAKSPWVLGSAVGVNLGLLVYCKYANFMAGNLNRVFLFMDRPPVEWAPVHLPIGISFFTFQALSYVLDVRSGKISAQKNPLDLALYISLFPQLIAGPIVRYSDIAKEITHRHSRLADMSEGSQRFLIGLGKKMLIANTVAIPVDHIFSLPADQFSPAVAWFAVICYALQIYFDFSGYSDMAIGLGRLFGFHFLENFNYPYISSSITDFWRRWHISLSTWFRDYLYIPLGGNRKGMRRTGLNLLIVFFLCGLWHGASWTFVIWGLLHGCFLIIERVLRHRVPFKRPRWFGYLYTLILVLCSWVFFRAESLPEALNFFKVMAGVGSEAPYLTTLPMLLNREVSVVVLLAVLGATPLPLRLWQKWLNPSKHHRPAHLLWGIQTLAMTMLMFACWLKLAANTHNPFIYFRF